MEALFKDMATGAPIIILVMGCVQWFKVTFKTEEPWTNIISMLVGLVFGGGYLYGVSKPTDYMAWFAVIVYGVGLGLVASGIFKVGVQIAQKAAVTALADATPLPVVVVPPASGAIMPTRMSEVRSMREARTAGRPTESDPSSHIGG